MKNRFVKSSNFVFIESSFYS